jgi:hypothetical protein
MQVDIQLLAFFCGHFLGDFVLQSDRLVELKSKHMKWMIFHVFQVSLLTWIFLGNFSAWWIVGILFFLHLLVDYAKIWVSSKMQSSESKAQNYISSSAENSGGIETKECDDGRNFGRFIGDQLLHILTLVVLWYCLIYFNVTDFQENRWELLLGLHYKKGLLLLTGLAIGISGVGVALKYQMSEFVVELGEQVKQGLPKGGKTIGILERLLVFMFVLAGKPEGVGFVIAAKSVFRIGELTNKQDKDHAEYIMIGTLRSFTYALAIAFIVKWLIGHI